MCLVDICKSYVAAVRNHATRVPMDRQLNDSDSFPATICVRRPLWLQVPSDKPAGADLEQNYNYLYGRLVANSQIQAYIQVSSSDAGS